MLNMHREHPGQCSGGVPLVSPMLGCCVHLVCSTSSELVCDLWYNAVQLQYVWPSGVMVIGGRWSRKEAKKTFYGQGWYILYVSTSHVQDKGPGQTFLQLHPPIDLLKLWRLQLVLWVLKCRPEVHILRMMEGLPQQGSVPPHSIIYTEAVNTLCNKGN